MKKYQSGALDAMVIIILVLVLAVGGVIFWQLSSSGTDEESIIDQPDGGPCTVAPEFLDESCKTSAADGAEPQDSEQTSLEAINGYTASGTATRTTSGGFVHEIMAEMGPPADGKFYEGWLVGPEVISTGPLEPEGNMDWSLSYSTSQDLSEYNQVVVTEETEENGLDGVPETHVLEGSF